MAVPKSGNRQTDEKYSFIDNINGQVSRSVVDEEGNDLLGQILSALGGSSNTTVNINNILTNATNEVSQALPNNTKGFEIYARGNSKIQLAYNVGESNTNFITIWPGERYRLFQFFTNQTIYFQTTKNDTVELITYV